MISKPISFTKRIERGPLEPRHCLYCGAGFQPKHSRHIACCNEHRIKLNQNYTPRTLNDDHRLYLSHRGRRISEGRRMKTKEVKAELEAHLAARDTLFRNPNLRDAKIWWDRQGWGEPAQIDVPLAAVHKARLQWLEATDKMLTESLQWLIDRRYQTGTRGAPPLTPERRDADRRTLGMPKLEQ